MAHFTTLELHHHAHLVSVAQKAKRVLDLGLKVVGVDTAGQLDLLELNSLLLFLRFLLTLATLEQELAVIHNLTYGGSSLCGHHHQIHALIVRQLQSLIGAHDAQRFAVGTDQANLFTGDLLIEQVFSLFVFCANSSTPPSKKISRTKKQSPHGPTRRIAH